MPTLYLITGIMASGKSTVAELLARRLERAVHLRGDVFRRMIVSGRVDMTADPGEEAMGQLALRYDLSAMAAEGYLRAGFDVVWQDVCVGRVLMDVVRRITHRPAYVVVLCPDPAAVARREAGRGKRGYGGGFTPENFDALLRAETPRIGLWLDSTGQRPEETADEILRRTGAGEGALDSMAFSPGALHLGENGIQKENTN